MNVLPREKQIQIVRALVEGNSIRSTARMVGVYRNTVLRLLERVGPQCETLLTATMRDLECERLQLDEIWSYVGKKARRVTPDDDRLVVGDQYIFVALDPDTKLMPCFEVGKRNTETAWSFAKRLRARVKNSPQISTDAFNAYPYVLGNIFGRGCAYGQIKKIYEPTRAGRGRYSPPRVVNARRQVIWGTPDVARITTSHVERSNLTMRMQMRRFTRLTNGFSKKMENHIHALNLHFAHYNLCRKHGSIGMTPAMAAGITNEPWDIEVLIPMNGHVN